MPERLRARRREISIGVARVALDDDQVAPVAAGIGKAPRHVAVAADDDARQAREGDAGDRGGARAGARIVDDDRRAVPDVRHVDREVHVVGDERRARSRPRTGHRPVVAAEAGGFLGLSKTGHGDTEARRFSWLLEDPEWSSPCLRVSVASFFDAAQIEDIRPGIGGRGKRPPVIGVSHSDPRAARKSYIGGGIVSASVPYAASNDACRPCSVLNIARIVRIVSSGFQGSGVAFSRRYSGGAARRPARPALTPAAYASRMARYGGAACSTAVALIDRKPWTKDARSTSTARAPTSAVSSPAAWRRCRSI